MGHALVRDHKQIALFYFHMPVADDVFPAASGDANRLHEIMGVRNDRTDAPALHHRDIHF